MRSVVASATHSVSVLPAAAQGRNATECRREHSNTSAVCVANKDSAVGRDAHLLRRAQVVRAGCLVCARCAHGRGRTLARRRQSTSTRAASCRLLTPPWSSALRHRHGSAALRRRGPGSAPGVCSRSGDEIMVVRRPAAVALRDKAQPAGTHTAAKSDRGAGAWAHPFAVNRKPRPRRCLRRRTHDAPNEQRHRNLGGLFGAHDDGHPKRAIQHDV